MMSIGEKMFNAALDHGKPLAFVCVFVAAFVAGALLFALLWSIASAIGLVPMAAVWPGAIGCGIGCAIVPASVCAWHA